MQATDETVRLVWDELVETDRMCRYYGYLSQRLDRLGDLLQIGSVSAASGAFVSLLSHFPDWVSATAAAIAILAGTVVILRRYPQKAARSAEMYRLLGRLQLESEHLWHGVWTKDDDELRSALKALNERQCSIVERAPQELPLSRSLARRSQREADRYWMDYAQA